jgi:hypothetical protein
MEKEKLLEIRMKKGGKRETSSFDKEDNIGMRTFASCPDTETTSHMIC